MVREHTWRLVHMMRTPEHLCGSESTRSSATQNTQPGGPCPAPDHSPHKLCGENPSANPKKRVRTKQQLIKSSRVDLVDKELW